MTALAFKEIYVVFRAESQGRNGADTWNKTQKTGKPETRSSWQDMDINVGKKLSQSKVGIDQDAGIKLIWKKGNLEQK